MAPASSWELRRPAGDLYPTTKDRRHQSNGIAVRVIEYQLPGVAGAEPLYRLVTSLHEPEQAPAQELAPLYHDRWEMETALDELERTCGAPASCCAARLPTWFVRSLYGLMLTHSAIRGLMHEATWRRRKIQTGCPTYTPSD